MTLPNDCIQSVVADGKWWAKCASPEIVRGALIQAFVPHIDQLPFTFEPISRGDPREHGSAVVRVGPLKVDAPLRRTDLPVAAMVLNDNEVWGAYKAKRRPCLVIGCKSHAVDKSLTAGKPNSSTAPTFIVAPYYGATPGGNRAGYNPVFVERVRQFEYPQFMWDVLPHDRGEESILRIDQLQPIGAHSAAYKPLGFKLTDTAMEVVDELLSWLLKGGVPADGLIAFYRDFVSNP